MAVYLLLGDDEERKARGVEKLRRGREVESYDASEITPEAAVSACTSYSLFGEGPFDVVRHLDACRVSRRNDLCSEFHLTITCNVNPAVPVRL